MEDEILKTILCRKMDNYTIADYNKDCKQGNKHRLANFIYERFNERYIEPFETMDPNKKNGFSIMAIACLMIEALENFWRGLKETTSRKANKFFESFFSRCSYSNNELSTFQGLNFYKNIRCGILHQAETKGEWKIRRIGPLLDKKTKIINATKFLDYLEDYLSWYQSELKKRDFKTDDIWRNFRKKMRFIKENCGISTVNNSTDC